MSWTGNCFTGSVESFRSCSWTGPTGLLDDTRRQNPAAILPFAREFAGLYRSSLTGDPARTAGEENGPLPAGPGLQQTGPGRKRPLEGGLFTTGRSASDPFLRSEKFYPKRIDTLFHRAPGGRSGEMKTLAVIPARGGSKGIPHKNIRTLGAGRCWPMPLKRPGDRPESSGPWCPPTNRRSPAWPSGTGPRSYPGRRRSAGMRPLRSRPSSTPWLSWSSPRITTGSAGLPPVHLPA